MRKKCGGVPLSRVWEYLASLPDYVPTDKFNRMERTPYKPGVDEHDYRNWNFTIIHILLTICFNYYKKT